MFRKGQKINIERTEDENESEPDESKTDEDFVSDDSETETDKKLTNEKRNIIRRKGRLWQSVDDPKDNDDDSNEEEDDDGKEVEQPKLIKRTMFRKGRKINIETTEDENESESDESKTDEAIKYNMIEHEEDKQLEDKMKKLYNIYENDTFENYAFPDWAIDKVLEHKDDLMKNVRVYYDKGADLKVVKKLVKEREPVNIATDLPPQHYNKEKLKKEFGWEEGYYNTYYKACKEKKLAPNIAVYTPAYFSPFLDGAHPDKITDYVKDGLFLHIINCVGYAFDHEDQVDYKYFFPKGKKWDNVKPLLIQRYKNIFNKIFKCAEDLGLDFIVMSFIGGGAFCELIPTGPHGADSTVIFIRDVFAPAFFYCLENSTLKSSAVIKFMGITNPKTRQIFNDHIQDHDSNSNTYIIEPIGLFPDIFNDQQWNQADLDKILFVNAWDPLSLPGNGNAEDEFLDGHIGRRTTIALTGSSMINSHIKQYIAVEE